MKDISQVLLVLAAAVCTGCLGTKDDNHGLAYDTLEVNFSAGTDGAGADGTEVGIFATCTRAEVVGTSMSEASPARYTLSGSRLKKVSDADAVTALSGDHNFMFYAFAPYDASIQDVASLPADIPSHVTFGQEAAPLLVAKASASGVVAPVVLPLKSVACTVRLKIPDDIVDEDGTVLRRMVLRAADAAEMTGALAYQARYDLYTDALTVTAGTESHEITVDFNDYQMPSGYTEVTFLAAPFTVPDSGFELEFTDVGGKTNTISFLNKKAGTTYAVGDVVDATISNSGDGSMPCTSPVRWPVGFSDGVGVFNNTVQPMWLTDHLWTSAQPQATLQYVVSESNPVTVKFETNNFSQYNYSSGCVKGSWTDDYFEFIVPVKKFAAGTTVTLTFPSYGRGNPLFWDVEYLDGETWKCDRISHTSPDGQFTRESTLMIEHGNRDGGFEGITYTVKMVHENEIKSGQLQIRMKVADGRYVTNPSGTYSTACRELAAPTTDGTCLFAFVNKSGKTGAISIEW